MGNPWVVQSSWQLCFSSRSSGDDTILAPTLALCTCLICLRKCLIRRGKKVFGKTGLCSVNCGALRAASGAEGQAECWDDGGH